MINICFCSLIPKYKRQPSYYDFRKASPLVNSSKDGITPPNDLIGQDCSSTHQYPLFWCWLLYTDCYGWNSICRDHAELRVLQNSVPSPTLFIIFIKNLFFKTTNPILNFAYDSSICYSNCFDIGMSNLEAA